MVKLLMSIVRDVEYGVSIINFRVGRFQGKWREFLNTARTIFGGKHCYLSASEAIENLCGSLLI